MARSTLLPSVSVPPDEVTARLRALDFRQPVFSKRDAERFFMAFFQSYWPDDPGRHYPDMPVIWLDSIHEFRDKLLDMGIYVKAAENFGAGPHDKWRQDWDTFVRKTQTVLNGLLYGNGTSTQRIGEYDIHAPTNPMARWVRLLNAATPPGSSLRRNGDRAAFTFYDSNYLAAFEHGLGYQFVMQHHIVLIPRPAIRTHQEGGQRDLVLNSMTGPAVTFAADKNADQYWIRGVQVRRFVVEDPSVITMAHIRAARTPELRRTLIDQYGLLRHSIQRGFVEVDRADQFGCILYATNGAGVRRCILEMVNSTPEPDGTHRHVARRVPGSMRTAHAAVAWTFGFDRPEQYHPVIQT